MNKILAAIIIASMSILGSCILPYIPSAGERQEVIVIQGQITDQPAINTVKISVTSPLWTNPSIISLRGCKVWITDNHGKADSLKETLQAGIYVTDPARFRGKIGSTYVLHVKTNADMGRLSYESFPMKMVPVPPIESLYYEKMEFQTGIKRAEGCKIFLNSQDNTGQCKFYRWDFTETWEFRLPFDVPNRICWISNDSRDILIKNTIILGGNRIEKYPIITITDPVDRLSERYSILVRQYSMNEDEYAFWERLSTVSGQTGGLYDVFPANIPNNLFCADDPSEKVGGYFSVSAVSSKRLFIDEEFKFFTTRYYDCIDDSAIILNPMNPEIDIPGLGTQVWIIKEARPLVYLTHKVGCADCSSRGTTVKPPYWDDKK